MKKKIFISIAVVAAIILISGASLLATASPATTSDPLITLSYLNNIFRTRLLNTEVAAERDALIKTLDDKVTKVEGDIHNYFTTPNTNLFTLVTLKNGNTLDFPGGSEIMLRTATGTAVLSKGSLMNYVNGSVQTTGNLVMNNMYIAMATDGGTITATGDATILIRGITSELVVINTELASTEDIDTTPDLNGNKPQCGECDACIEDEDCTEINAAG
jgi:hypothetical protein